MANRNKAYSIILYLIWPFSALILGIKNFDSRFGRNLLVAFFGFLGFTASQLGDLQRYAQDYYKMSKLSFGQIFDTFASLQMNKFFNNLAAVVFSVFNNYHVYFAFLFLVYGYFLISSLNFFRVKVLKKTKLNVVVSFIAFALFYSVLTVANYAFYTGGIYFIYCLLHIIFDRNKTRYYFAILLTPLFHLGLSPLLLVPVFYFLFKKKTEFYLIALIVFTVISRSFLIGEIGNKLSGSNNVLETRYKYYASDQGREFMDTHYAEGYKKSNDKNKVFINLRNFVNQICLPLLLFLLLLLKPSFRKNPVLVDLLNLSIGCLSITQIMLNISQGDRFYFISGFMILGLFMYYVQTVTYKHLKFKYLFELLIIVILLEGIISLIIARGITDADTYLSNFLILMFK